MSKTNLLIIILLVSQILVFSQENDYYYPKDSLLPEYDIFKNNHLSFLIKDDTYYNFYIDEITPLKNGYFIRCITIIDTFTVSAYVITDKIPKLFYAKKIKQTEVYHLCLKRYNVKPLVASLDTYENVDVMIGENIVHIGAAGSFNYIFTSKNLNGLSYVDSFKVKKKLIKYEIEKEKIRNTIELFINAISYDAYSKNLYIFVDTNLLKESIKNHSQSIVRRTLPSVPSKLYPPYNPVLIDWNEVFNINPNDFSTLFWKMININMNLPIKSNIDTNLTKIYDIKMELLHMSKDGIYTIRTKWKLFENGDEYCAMINIKKEKNKYTIIGFNRPR